MKIEVRRIAKGYIDIVIRIDNTTFELGLFDYEEAKALAEEIQEGVDDILKGWELNNADD